MMLSRARPDNDKIRPGPPTFSPARGFPFEVKNSARMLIFIMLISFAPRTITIAFFSSNNRLCWNLFLRRFHEIAYTCVSETAMMELSSFLSRVLYFIVLYSILPGICILYHILYYGLYIPGTVLHI